MKRFRSVFFVLLLFFLSVKSFCQCPIISPSLTKTNNGNGTVTLTDTDVPVDVAVYDLLWYTYNSSGTRVLLGKNITQITVSDQGYYDCVISYLVTNCITTTEYWIQCSDIIYGSITAASSSVCGQGTTTLTGPSGMDSYSWSDGTNVIGTTQSIHAGAGVYTLTIAKGSCSGALGSFTVTGYPLPVQPAAFTAGPSAVCQAAGNEFYTIPNDPTVTYSWSYSGSGVNITNSNNTGIINFGPTAQSGTLSVVAINGCGTSAPRSMPITVNPVLTPSINISASSSTICNSATVNFSATSINAGTSPTYQWQVNGNKVGSNSSTFSANSLANGDIVTCILTSNAVCALPVTATSNGISMTVIPQVAPTVAISASQTTICSGNTVTFTATATNGGGSPNYQWKLNNSAVGTNTSTFSTGSLANGDVVTCTLTSNAVCVAPAVSNSNSIIMSVNPSPTVGIDYADNKDGTYTLTTSPTSTWYSWAPGGQVTRSIVVSQAGTYTVTATNTSFCTATASYSLNCSAPKPGITLSGASAICSGSSVTLTASAGQSYLWSSGQTTQSIEVNTPGTYSVMVTYAGGCANSSDPIVITQLPLPNTSIIAVLNPSDGSVLLTAAGGQSYLWSSGETTASVTKDLPGTYSVIVTASNGCSAGTAYTIQDNGMAGGGTLTIIPSGPTAICADGSARLSASAGASSYIWNTGSSDASIIVNTGGIYTVTALYGGSQKIERTSVSVSVNPLPTPRISAALNANGSVTLTATGGSSYTWSSGETAATITKSSPGSYSVTATNTSGCSGVAVYSIQNNSNGGGGSLTITPAGPTTFCSGGSVTLAAATGADSYIWNTGATTPSITVTTGGTYTVSAVYSAVNRVEKAAITVEVRDDLAAMHPFGELFVSADSIDFGTAVTASAAFQNAGLYSWDFGDGVTTTWMSDSSMRHFYYQPGHNTITVSILSKYHCLLMVQRTVVVAKEPVKDTTATLPGGNYRFNIFPNPFHGNAFLTCRLGKPGTVRVEVFTANGKVIGRYEYAGQLGDNYFELKGTGGLVANVLYFFRVSGDGQVYYEKLLKY